MARDGIYICSIRVDFGAGMNFSPTICSSPRLFLAFIFVRFG